MGPVVYGRTPAVTGRSEAIVSHTRRTRHAVPLVAYGGSKKSYKGNERRI